MPGAAADISELRSEAAAHEAEEPLRSKQQRGQGQQGSCSDERKRRADQARPESLGDPQAVDFSKVDPDAVQELMAAYISSDAAAATALRGLRAGAFVIPTHAFQKDDVEARYRETIAGFDLVE